MKIRLCSHSQVDDLAVLLHHFSWTHAPTFPCSFWRDTPRSKTWSPNPTNEDSPSPCAPSAGPLPPADILSHLRWGNTWVRIPRAMRSLSTKGGTRWPLPRGYDFSNFVVSNTLASTSWQLGKDGAILRVCMRILVPLRWLWWGVYFIYTSRIYKYGYSDIQYPSKRTTVTTVP